MQGDVGRYLLLEHLHALPREPQLLLHLGDLLLRVRGRDRGRVGVGVGVAQAALTLTLTLTLLRGGRQPILQCRELRGALLAHLRYREISGDVGRYREI